MLRTVALIFLLTVSLPTLSQSLKVSADQRHLVHDDGTPFFWLGDTAWELFHRLNRKRPRSTCKTGPIKASR